MKLAISLAALFALSAPAFAGPRLAETPELPSADRIGTWIRDRVGQTAKADVLVCAASDGHVMSVQLVRGSGYAAFDRAVISDVREWHYAAGSIPKCVRTKIEYRVR